MPQAREWAVALAGGAFLGLAAILFGGPSDSALPDEAQADQTAHQIELQRATLEADLKAAARNAEIAALAHREYESAQVQNLNPAQAWAASILASGEPLTIREMAILSQILEGTSAPDMGGYDYEPVRSTRYRGGYTAAPEYSRNVRPSSVLDASDRFRESSNSSRARNAPQSLDTAGTNLSGRNSGARAGAAINSGAIDVRTGQYHAPAGTGYVNTQNGTYYARSGPNGVIDTRTGAYIPTVP